MNWEKQRGWKQLRGGMFHISEVVAVRSVCDVHPLTASQPPWEKITRVSRLSRLPAARSASDRNILQEPQWRTVTLHVMACCVWVDLTGKNDGIITARTKTENMTAYWSKTKLRLRIRHVSFIIACADVVTAPRWCLSYADLYRSSQSEFSKTVGERLLRMTAHVLPLCLM